MKAGRGRAEVALEPWKSPQNRRTDTSIVHRSRWGWTGNPALYLPSRSNSVKLPEAVSTRCRLRRAAVIELLPWNTAFSGKPESKPASKVGRDPLKLARYYQALLETGRYESRTALARHPGVSRARFTQVLNRLADV